MEYESQALQIDSGICPGAGAEGLEWGSGLEGGSLELIKGQITVIVCPGECCDCVPLLLQISLSAIFRCVGCGGLDSVDSGFLTFLL